MHVVLWRTFLIYWRLQWTFATIDSLGWWIQSIDAFNEPLQLLIHWVDESNLLTLLMNLCNYWFIGLMNPMGVNLVIMDSLGLELLMEFVKPDNISIIGHVFLKLCIMYFYRKGEYWQIVWLGHVIHPMFLLWCLF